MQSPTHTVTIEHHVVTGEVDDGMGGTKPTHDWEPYAEGVPARYTPAGEGYVRAVHGEVEREAPVVRIHPEHVGSLVDDTYACDVDDDGDWRVSIDGIGDVDDYQLVTDVRETYGFGTVPDTVTLELELQDG